VHRALHLQHHRHTGRKLAHHHTSYRGLLVVLGLASALIIGLNILAKVTADSLYVYATVPAPIPTTAPVITSPQNGAVASVGLSVTGSCPITVPPVVIVIALDDVEVGSTPCNAGGFTFPLVITPGGHSLQALAYTITGDRGPDSAKVYISYSADANQAPGRINPTTTDQSLGLQFHQTKPFVVFGPTKNAIWTGEITGGTLPYQVRIDWGDGATEDLVVKTSSTQAFSHHYHAMKPYHLTITVTDKMGRSASAHYAAVTPYRSPAAQLGITGGGGSPLGGGKLFLLYGSYLVLLFTIGIIWGRRRQFAYAPVPVRSRPFMHRYTRAYHSGQKHKTTRR
jgi:hypothetical protein